MGVYPFFGFAIDERGRIRGVSCLLDVLERLLCLLQRLLLDSDSTVVRALSIPSYYITCIR
jgi:hypothetical protein